MKRPFIKRLMEYASNNRDVILMTGDLGFSHFEVFIDKFPNQYFNAGIAEQNMIGVAAGLALNGKKVFVYSIAPFVTARCFEQIKLDLCYHKLNVILIGAGGGLCYSKSGATHQAFEDIGILRTLPNMTVLCPGDISELDACFDYAINCKGPVYIRISHDNSDVHKSHVDITKPIKVFENAANAKSKKKTLVLTTGDTLGLSIDVAKELSENELNENSLALYSVPLVKPCNKEALVELISEQDYVFTVEEHVGEGGFGSLIAEELAESGIKKPFFKRFYLKKPLVKKVGSQEYIRGLAGLSKETIKKEICDAVLRS
jgi:transketolase